MDGSPLLAGRYWLGGPCAWPGPTGAARCAEDPAGRPLVVLLLRDAVTATPYFAGRVARARSLMRSASGRSLVPVVDVVVEEGTTAVVVETAAARDLGRLLAEGPLAPATACALAADVADGLAAAHAAGVLHLRLDPRAVLLTDGAGPRATATGPGVGPGVATVAGTVATVAGAGVAQLLEGPAWSPPDTAGRSWRDYAAPELRRGAPGGPAADLHALGAVLHEALTGRVPAADGGGEAAALPQPLSELLAQLLARDPDLRPPDAAWTARRLRDLAEHVRTGTAGRRRTPHRRSSPSRGGGQGGLSGSGSTGGLGATAPRTSRLTALRSTLAGSSGGPSATAARPPLGPTPRELLFGAPGTSDGLGTSGGLGTAGREADRDAGSDAGSDACSDADAGGSRDGGAGDVRVSRRG